MKNLFTLFAILILFVAFITIQGCSSPSLVIDKEISTFYKTDSIVIVDKSIITENQEAISEFATALTKEIFDGNIFKKGTKLTLQYNITKIEPGEQFTRWCIGFGAGKGEFTVEVIYFDSEGKELARIHTTQAVSGGLLGGSFSTCIDNAVKDIVDYTKEKFLYSTK